MIRVLIVDDDFMVGRVHRGFVERIEGFSVVAIVHTGEAALAAAEQERPDLVLLDLYLPDIFGLDVLSQLRSAGLECDVIVITAAKELDAVRTAVRHGVADYILKPFTQQVLQVRLERYASQRSLVQGLGVSGQDDVDRALARMVTTTSVPLPKGLSSETARMVEQSLRTQDGPTTATECAGQLGLSRVSARRYLEYFSGTGQVEVTLKYGAAGRPERMYHWLGRGRLRTTNARPPA